MLEHNFLYDALRTVHVISIIVWIGGMYFAHFFLRPSLSVLEPAQRLKLMHAVLGRFFAAVIVASLAAIGSGVWMIGRMAKIVSQTGGNFSMPWTWAVMSGLGILMLAIFFYIRLVLFKSLTTSVQSDAWQEAGVHLGRIRHWVAVNMMIGTAIIILQLLFG